MTETKKRPAPWSTEENAALVALYFAMLDEATAGRPYNKAAMIRAVQAGKMMAGPFAGAPLHARSKQSIEFKLMNATAAHRDIGDGIAGRVTVTMDGYGYRAMPNYQATLKDAVHRALEQIARGAYRGAA